MTSFNRFIWLLFTVMITPALHAQSAYKGLYTGWSYLEVSGPLSIPERPVGVVLFTIDEDGYIFGNLEGQVDAAGNITWDTNTLGFTTGQINGDGNLTATGSIVSGPTTSTNRIDAQNQAGGFGRNADSIAYEFQWLSPRPASGDFNDVTFADGQFVAVGEGGIAASSGDGQTWFPITIPSGVDLNGVAYGNGLWVVGGDANTAFISTDLSDWTPVVIGGVNVNDITFADGKFYAGTLNSGIMSSTDGESWSQVYAASSADIGSIQYLNGLLIGQYRNISGSASLLISSNGSDWTSLGLGLGEAGRATYGNGMWVFPFTRKIYRFSQSDASDLASIDTNYNTNAIGFVDGQFVDGDYYISNNAVDWSQAPGLPFVASKNEQDAFASNGSTLVAVGESIVSTDDAVTFTLRSTRPVDTTSNLVNVVQGGGKWLIAGGAVTATSTNLENWTTTQHSGATYLNATYGAGGFLATGAGPSGLPVVYRSNDGHTWENVGDIGFYNFDAIAYGNGIWVAASAGDEQFHYSINGEDWTTGQSFDGHVIDDIEFINGGFVAIGSTSFISSDGKTWTRGGGTGGVMHDVDYHDGLYVAVGDNNSLFNKYGRVRTSTDALNWTDRTPEDYLRPLNGVRYAGGHWVAVGNNDDNDHGATVLESINGVDWEVAYMSFDGELFGLEAANGRLIAVGSDGAVLSIPYADTSSPYFKQQPISQSIDEGDTLTLTVDFGGEAPVDIQWLKDGEPLFDGLRIGGSRTATLTIDDASPEDAGSYTVAINNSAGGRISDAAVVTINTKPVITAQPSSVTVSSGAAAQFLVTAEDATSYQWYLNGEELPGATNATYDIAAADVDNVGAYEVVITNAAGDTTSATATLSLRTGGSGVNLALDNAFNGNAPELASTLGFDSRMLHEVSEVIVQPDGKIIVTGLFEYTHPTLGKRGSIVRLNTDGTIDESFAPPTFSYSTDGQYVVSKISSATLLSDGRLVVACAPQKIGAAYGTGSGGSFNSKRFLMLNADGSWDSTFALSPEPSSTIGLTSDSQDRILLGGYYVNSSSTQKKVARYLTNGSLDTSFGDADLGDEIDQPVDYPFLIQGDGDILLGAYYNGFASMGVLRLGPDGELLSATANPEVQPNWIQRLIPASDGGFYVIGSFQSVEGRTQYGIARADANGDIDTDYVGPDTIGADFWHGVELPDRSFIAVGPTSAIGPQNARAIARLDPNTGEVMDDPVIGTGFGEAPNQGSASEYPRAADIDPSRNAVYIAGNITSLNGVVVPEIFKLSYTSGGGDTEALAIVAQPQSIEGERGETVTLSVGAIGGNLSFQWYQNDALLPGETGSSLTLVLDDASKQGDYHVVVSDDSGSVDSAVATVSFPETLGDFLSAQAPGHQNPMDIDPVAGMPNALAYAFDAEDGDQSKLPQQSLAKGDDLGLSNNFSYLVMQYRQRREAFGLTIRPRLSRDLASLPNGEGQVARVGPPQVDGDGVIYTYRSLQPLEELGPRVFMDVVVEIETEE